MIGIKNINFGCHKIPERCFSLNGKPMPFCSRCLGCSIGHIASFLLFIFGSLPTTTVAILLIIPLAIDWSTQEFLKVNSNNYRRLITGILAGLGVGIIIWKLLAFVWRLFQ